MGLDAAAETALSQCMNLQADESCAIITDDERAPIGQTLYAVAQDITQDAVLVQYPPGSQHGQEPPAPVAGAMRSADVFVAPTTKSLSHTRARSRACEAGARGATMPGITEDVMTEGLDADYDAIAHHCEEVLAQVRDADEIHVTSPQGTDITFTVGSRQWQLDTGINHEPGDFSNLPAGEVFISPESAEGTYVVDGTMRPHGRVTTPIEIQVADGYVTDISDSAVRQEVEAAAEDVGQAAYNVAELGIGTNIGVTGIIGSVLLDEKAGGTVHIAIGDDASIGGDVEAPIHTDGILTDPTVFAGGTKIQLPKSAEATD